MPVSSENQKQKVYDVAILGSGIGGTMLAAILARQGIHVLLIEEGVHPRFAVGESIVPETASMFRVVAEKFQVPEIAYLSTAYTISRHVSSNCGVKRAFSFVYQREGKSPDPHEITQFPTLAPPLGPDTHMFRQDIDAYMLAVAVRYGSEIAQKTKVVKLEREETGYSIETSRGTVRCRFVVDAAGYNSPLAKMHGLRDEPCRFYTDSRSVFTHMVGVRPYDECGPSRKEHGMHVPFHESTLHHVFDGGWLWVIPFDNSARSTNPLCSVGLVFDRRKSPKAEGSAEEEFRAFVSRYPTLETQFRDARSVREWTSTGRLQYSSRKLAGDRFCLLGHAGGFIDPLFSSGLGMTVVAVNGAADALIPALAENDFSLERFADFENGSQRNLDHYDSMVGRAFDSFVDFPLFNAWFRVWVTGNILGSIHTIARHFKCREMGRRKSVEGLRQSTWRSMAASDLDEFRDVVDKAAEHVDAARAGSCSTEQAASRIVSLLASTKMSPPMLRLDDLNARSTHAFTTFGFFRLYLWIKWTSPRKLRDVYFAASGPLPLLAAYSRGAMDEIVHGIRTTAHFVRDMFRTWNLDWQKSPNSSERRPPATPANRQLSYVNALRPATAKVTLEDSEKKLGAAGSA